jgi:hypothetical protein
MGDGGRLVLPGRGGGCCIAGWEAAGLCDAGRLFGGSGPAKGCVVVRGAEGWGPGVCRAAGQVVGCRVALRVMDLVTGCWFCRIRQVVRGEIASQKRGEVCS